MLNFSFTTLSLAAVAILLVGRSIYRLYFHPLSKFPGPRLAAISTLYEFYYDVISGGKFMFEIKRMHEQYGIYHVWTD